MSILVLLPTCLYLSSPEPQIPGHPSDILGHLAVVSPMISRSKGAGRCKKRPWKIQSWLRINHRRMVGCLGAQLVRSIIRHEDS